MAPFARRRAQICVPAAFMRKVKRFEEVQQTSARGARLSPNFFRGLFTSVASPRRCQSKQQYAAGVILACS